jgi:hypothetical protein
MPSERTTASPVLLAATLTIVLRVVYGAIGCMSAPYLRLDERLIGLNAYTGHLMQRSEGWRYALLGVWERFDTLWYIHIAHHGYDNPVGTVFYPLYPLLIRALEPVFRDPLITALAIATVSTFFLFWGLYRLIELDLPADAATRAVILASVWPSSFVFLAGYPESLLLALIVWSIWWARRGNWWLAGLLGGLAGLAKAVGVLVVIPLAWIAWRERNWKISWPGLAAGIPAAVFLLWLRVAGPGSLADIYPRYWNIHPAPPWTNLYEAAHRAIAGGSYLARWNLLALALIAVFVLVKRVRPEYTWFAVAAMLMFLSKSIEPPLQSLIRYVLVIFPAYAGLAQVLKSRTAMLAVQLLFFLLNWAILILFFDWYPLI